MTGGAYAFRSIRGLPGGSVSGGEGCMAAGV